jgi:Mn2+/Fe2+ NRAMP family transporter
MAMPTTSRRNKRGHSGSAKSWAHLLGPGLITGASDDDPSGIATYSQSGAQFGFAISWTMLFSYPLMVAIQQISARIGRTTGKGIAGNIRQHYPAWLLQGIVWLLFVAKHDQYRRGSWRDGRRTYVANRRTAPNRD